MAIANPVLDSFTKYLKTSFACKEDWDAMEVLNETFKYEDVKQAMVEFKTTDPGLHRILSYRWQTARSRNDIANSLYLDPSTLKRQWDKAMFLVINRLVNKEASAVLEPIDLIQKI